MTQIYNSQLFKEIREGTKNQQLRDAIPSQLADKIVPVMEVNPKMLRRVTISKTNNCNNATSAIIYTTPATQDFYLSSMTLSLIKDSTATSTATYITANINNVGQTILIILGFSVTAQQQSLVFSSPIPIKIDRGSNIMIYNTTNVANISATGIINGFIDETPNA